MIAGIFKLGGWGGLGFLAGVVAVWWIEPNTKADTGLVLTVCIVAFTVVGAIISSQFGKTKPPDKIKPSESTKPFELNDEDDGSG
jgi:hypothetical protein